MKKFFLIAVMVLIAVAPLANAGTAVFVKLDEKTKGNWEGIYGKDGYKIAVDFAEKLPAGVKIDFVDSSTNVWTNTSEDRAPHKPGKKENRIAACWYGDFGTKITVGEKMMQLAIYALDWDGADTRAMNVEIKDGEKVLDKRDLSTFSNGKYLVYNVSGTITVKLTSLTFGSNAAISGFFLDPVQAK